MYEFTLLQKITVWIIPVLFAITVHEVAHGWVASKLGDPTAKMLGRLTLNPLKHIDPVGTILIPALTLMLAGIVFGYAKPVPVTFQNLRNPKRDMAIVAAAGPLANLLMIILWIILIRVALLVHADNSGITLFLVAMGTAGIYANMILMVLNLIPIPPLDGGRVLTGVLPGPASYKFAQIEPYGMIILIALLATGVLGRILYIPINLLLTGFADMAGIGKILDYVLYAIGLLK